LDLREKVEGSVESVGVNKGGLGKIHSSLKNGERPHQGEGGALKKGKKGDRKMTLCIEEQRLNRMAVA